MVDWANVRWWVAFVTSNIFGGLSPAKDWVKHLVPVLWPKDKAKANLEPVAERSAQTISRLEGLEPLLTNVSDLCSSLEAQGTRAKEQVSLLDKREIHLNERLRLERWLHTGLTETLSQRIRDAFQLMIIDGQPSLLHGCSIPNIPEVSADLAITVTFNENKQLEAQTLYHVHICYTPIEFLTEEQRERKVEAFKRGYTTSYDPTDFVLKEEQMADWNTLHP
ncbi:hypothetical protein BDV37DRAFT_278636 [Aspergillus pseudonomiae]|uniref:Uncharacterized protein n=1 Tax=Aspergillus pseudonomiae TaxID=1506151 RepID=A0A5N7DQ90_9EURO|nr:uncharacterized protein BDV37DRAFT_278636 [Aspergillus pseudonomiae]KAE8408627.1 hypothetical protein BDV37DRAFT_278636 [Aspergillus pseudonomiae]